MYQFQRLLSAAVKVLLSVFTRDSPAAVVEYRGNQPPLTTYGNARKSAEPYVRTPAKTMRRLEQQVNHKTPKQVYMSSLSEDNVDDAPRHLQSVRDKAKYARQNERASAQKSHRLNFADEVLQVLAMASNVSFVREVRVSGERVPCVVLYTERQLQDVKSFCFDAHNGSVWSFDKTFNLGALYVTVSTYQNLALNRATSGRSPTFIGPLFVHGQSTVDTYHYFFSRLASRMLELNFHVRRFKISRITDGQLSILIVINMLIIYICADSCS